ncbi:MAG TPA: crosslink repair DNA glycosylase YcaQ family protein [Polyangiaceae bacterium]|nr:crosslink repair DNA glycosylase YcaQ family protein [Polyangiaceae bacterium]
MKQRQDPSSFPIEAVAALFLQRQHLDRPRKRRLTADSLSRFAADTGGIQIDSINVIERAHYLIAWSRFGHFDRRTFDRLVYRRRVLFEYWAHAACLISASHFPWWRRAMLDYSLRSRGWGRWLQKNRALVARIEAAIAAGGPLGSADFERDRQGEGGGWWNWKPSTHALDYLWMSGRALVHSRTNFQKRFDLAERVMPDAMAEAPVSADAFRRWHLCRSLYAMGAATPTDLRMYLTFPRAAMTERRRVLGELIASGEVVRIAVENAGGTASEQAAWYALASDLPHLAEAARRRRPSRGTTMLAPFDSFLWHRDRTMRLFGFNYRIEVYTPEHKRVHGYYVMPILHDGQLIGRLDAKTHRREGRFEAKRIHFESWFARKVEPPAASWGNVDRDEALFGVAEALHALAKFVGAETVSLGDVSPSALASPMKRALAAAAAPVTV